MQDLFIILICAVFGALFGNFATSFYFRLPRNIPINGHPQLAGQAPHCSSCGHVLRFYEYFPILNFIFTRGRCNYCNVKIDTTYHLLEFSSILSALCIKEMHGLNFAFVAKLPLAVLFILIAALYQKHQHFFKELSLLALGIALIQQNYLIVAVFGLGAVCAAISKKLLRKAPCLVGIYMLVCWGVIVFKG